MFRPIYEPRTKAREYCDLAVNIYTGCNHGCVYCYAPRVLRKTQADFSSSIQPREDIVESVKRQLSRESMEGQKIMLCFTCDPYPADIDTTPTREIIKAIKESGNHVQILTKGGNRAVRDFDLLDKNDSFGITISGNPLQMHENEPGAARYSERIWALAVAANRDIKTWVSFEPVYDAQTVYDAIKNIEHIGLYKIGKLNYLPSDIDWHEFGHECERLCKEHGRNYYIKEDLRKAMEA